MQLLYLVLLNYQANLKCFIPVLKKTQQRNKETSKTFTNFLWILLFRNFGDICCKGLCVRKKNISLHVYKHLNMNFILDFVTCLCSDSLSDLHTQGELVHALRYSGKSRNGTAKILLTLYDDQNLQHSDLSIELLWSNKWERWAGI